MNEEEVKYAFRVGGHAEKDWGSNMNLGLINRILKPYLYDRQDISLIEAGLAKDNYSRESSKAWWREQIEEAYQVHLAGSKGYLHHYMFDILEQDGYFIGFETARPKDNYKNQLIKNFFQQAKQIGLKNIYVRDNG